MSDYFLGSWSGQINKPYTDRKGNSGEADRFVPKQPYVFTEDSPEAVPVYNERKLSELPYCLMKAGNLDQLKREALCNFNFLYYKILVKGYER